MLQSFIAFTNEIDDVDVAVSELMAQLDFGGANRLLENSIGIVSCYSEYVESGVFAALCEKLPFELIGATTIANMAGGELGETMLCLMVLTSSELCFSTNLTDPVSTDDVAPLKACYEEALAKLPGKPALMLSFAPLLNTFSSDFYVDSMSEISGNVPNYGTLAVDHNADYHDSQVLLNGHGFKDRFAMLLVHGPVKPVFYVGAISDKKIFEDRSVVTASDGNLLQMVNGVPVLEYLRSIGLKQNEDGTVVGINSFPVIVDYNDGTTPVARAMFATTPEGYAVCGGNVPVGSTLAIGSFDEEDIVTTTPRTLAKALEAGKHSTLLMYSCIGRYFAQGYSTTAEFQSLLKALDQSSIHYMAAYSGGEICPVYGKGGESFNRNHNNSFVICAL